MMYSAYILWNSEYCNEKFEEVCDAIRALIPLVHAVCKGKPSNIFLGKEIVPVFVGEKDGSVSHIELGEAGKTGRLAKADFRQPEAPVYYDSTAGAIAASGLIEMQRTSKKAKKQTF